MATNYIVTGMADYINGDPIIALADIILQGDSFNVLTVQEGVKASDKVLDISGTAIDPSNGDYAQVGGYSGSTTLKDVTITVKEVNIKENYKKKTLNAKLAQIAEKLGSNPEEMVYGDIIMKLKGEEMNSWNEKALWLGAADGSLYGVASTTLIGDGFVKQLDSDASTLKSGIAPRALTTDASILEDVEAMCNKRPVNFVDTQTYLFMPTAHFEKYSRALYGLNQQVIDANTLGAGVVKELQVPGRNVIAHATPGLNGSNFMVLTRPENFVIGTDLVSEDEQLSLKYQDLIYSYELFALWKLGAKVIRPHEAVINKA